MYVLSLGDSAVSFSAVTQGVTDVLGVVTTMITTIVGNPILCALVGAGFIPIALKIFKKMKNASK